MMFIVYTGSKMIVEKHHHKIAMTLEFIAKIRGKFVIVK